MSGPATFRRASVVTALGLALLLLSAWGSFGAFAAGPRLVAAAPAENQCNGTDNVGGEAVACDVTVTNNLDVATGATSSTVTLKECHGAANAPLVCTTTTTPSNQLVTSVTQCDGSGSGGGGEVRCNVNVVNNITGTATATPATINQCNGSGTGGGIQPTVSCSPLGSTVKATVNQCNSSGNGGGGTMRVQCTVSPSTASAALPVTVDQCNGSGNGGGATVTCSASVTNNIALAPAGPPPATTPPASTPPTSGPPAAGSPTPVATASGTGSGQPTSSPTPGTTSTSTSGPPTSTNGGGLPPNVPGLPNTGSEAGTAALAGLGMLGLGCGALFAARRPADGWGKGRHRS